MRRQNPSHVIPGAIDIGTSTTTLTAGLYRNRSRPVAGEPAAVLTPIGPGGGVRVRLEVPSSRASLPLTQTDPGTLHPLMRTPRRSSGAIAPHVVARRTTPSTSSRVSSGRHGRFEHWAW